LLDAAASATLLPFALRLRWLVYSAAHIRDDAARVRASSASRTLLSMRAACYAMLRVFCARQRASAFDAAAAFYVTLIMLLYACRAAS